MYIRMDREATWALWAPAAPDVRLGGAELEALEEAELCALVEGCPAEEVAGDDLRACAELMDGDGRCPGLCRRAVELPGAAVVRAAMGR